MIAQVARPPAATPVAPSRQAIDARLRQLEADHGLLEYEVDGWCVWPLVRFSVDAAHYGDRPSARRNTLSLTQQLACAVRDLPALAGLPRSRLATVTYASNRSDERDGRFQDVFFDPLLAELGAFYKIEHVDNVGFLTQRRHALIPADMTTAAFDLAASALARLPGPRGTDGVAAGLHAALQAGLGDAPLSRQQLALLLRRFVWLKGGYGALLRRLRPRHLLLVSAYADHALVAAAKEQGIEVIELQHGVLDRYHSGYSWPAEARRHKARMPIPDRLWLYGRYWAEELAANGFWGDALRLVGSLRLDAYRQHRSEPDEDAYTVVLTSQGWAVDAVAAFLRSFLELAEHEPPWRLVIKLHPGERSRAPYEAALSGYPMVTVVSSAQPPSTFQLLCQAHVHVSISSTCHFEALGLGVPTVILPFEGHEMVDHLSATGYAERVESPAELWAAVARWRDRRVPEHIGHRFFEPNALPTMMRELGYA